MALFWGHVCRERSAAAGAAQVPIQYQLLYQGLEGTVASRRPQAPFKKGMPSSLLTFQISCLEPQASESLV